MKLVEISHNEKGLQRKSPTVPFRCKEVKNFSLSFLIYSVLFNTKWNGRMEAQRYEGFNAVSKSVLVPRILKFSQRAFILTFISIAGNLVKWERF